MNIEKVQQLRDFLTNLKPHQEFDHSAWNKVHERTIGRPDPNTCGTSACICGWLAISEGDAELQQRMFYGRWEWTLPTNADWFSYGAEKLGISREDGRAVFAPNYHEYAAPDAIEEWPYITEDEYSDLYESGVLDLHTTTVKHAIAFLDMMIQERRVDIRWWANIKKDTV